MTTLIGKAIAIKGTVHASEAVAISGTVHGDVVVLNGVVTIEKEGRVDGTVTAKEIIVHGTSSGRLVATEIVRLQAGCAVTAEIAALKLSLEDGAAYTGRVEPARLEAAARVAAHRQGG